MGSNVAINEIARTTDGFALRLAARAFRSNPPASAIARAKILFSFAKYQQ